MTAVAPAGWEIARLRFRARVNPKASFDLDPAMSVSFLPMDAIGDDGSLRLDQIRVVSEVSQGYTYFEDGDVSIAKITPCFENGKGAVMQGLVEGAGFGTTELIVLRPEPTVDARFLYYLTQSSHFRDPGEAAMLGAGGQKRVPDLYVKDFETAWPSKSTQSAIASYLDAETKRIDGLLAEKTLLLGMLEEYRSSAIFELLEGDASRGSQGCDPKLGWLRSVPSHWVVCGLGKRYEVQLGKMLDAKQITGEHLRPYLRNQDVQWRHINVDNLPLMDFDAADQQKFSLQKGDVLVCEGGEVGRAAVWNSDFECFYQKAIHRLRPLTSEDEPEFVVLLLETAVKHGVFNTAEKSTIAHLPADQLRQHRFPFPPRSEQRQIVDQSRLVSDRVRELQKHVATEIEMLKDLRSSTITDAVLGRIDVRHHMKN